MSGWSGWLVALKGFLAGLIFIGSSITGFVTQGSWQDAWLSGFVIESGSVEQVLNSDGRWVSMPETVSSEVQYRSNNWAVVADQTWTMTVDESHRVQRWTQPMLQFQDTRGALYCLPVSYSVWQHAELRAPISDFTLWRPGGCPVWAP